jgi:hypothetical protein
MKLSALLLACVLALLQASAAAESAYTGHGATMARIDFKVTIPHTLRVSLAQLENPASAPRVALSVASNYGQVTIADALNGQVTTLPPRSRAGLVQYRSVVARADSAGAISSAAVRTEKPAAARVEAYVVAAP